MFCKNCGSEIKTGASFCGKCGVTVNQVSEKIESVSQEGFVYSKDWTKKGLYVASIPRFDILILNNTFYIIQFPKSYAGTWGLVIGILLFNFVGAIVGAMIGQSMEKKKREKLRMEWVDLTTNRLTSNQFMSHLLVSLPLTHFQEKAHFDGRTLEIGNAGETIKIKSSLKEVERISGYISQATN